METYINATAKVVRNQEHCGVTVNDNAIMARDVTITHCLALYRLMHPIPRRYLSHSMR